MGMKVAFTSDTYKLFEYLFLHPGEWLGTRDLANGAMLKNRDVKNVSSRLRRSIDYLKAEDLVLEERRDGHAMYVKFKGEIKGDPREEARLWYQMMLEATKDSYRSNRYLKDVKAPVNSSEVGKPKPPASGSLPPRPDEVDKKPLDDRLKLLDGSLVMVSVDVAARMAFVRVPLDKLVLVLEVISGRVAQGH